MKHAIKSKDGQEIPQVGFGLWQVKSQADFDRAFAVAVKAGYRHFDTAQIYGNEQMLGAAMQKSNLKRADVWITTKIAVNHFGYRHSKKAFEVSLQKLQTDYVDLLLLHFPVPLLRKSSWRALEELKAASKAKSIGVSNYTIRHLEQMKKYARELPAVNQVELHVFLQQPELLDYCRQNNIVVEAYSPLAHAKAGAGEPLLQELAHKYHKSFAQIMLRWLTQQGLVILPKSVTPKRIQENIDIFDFKLDDEDMQKLATLNKNLRTCWSPVHVP